MLADCRRAGRALPAVGEISYTTRSVFSAERLGVGNSLLIKATLQERARRRGRRDGTTMGYTP